MKFKKVRVWPPEDPVPVNTNQQVVPYTAPNQPHTTVPKHFIVQSKPTKDGPEQIVNITLRRKIQPSLFDSLAEAVIPGLSLDNLALRQGVRHEGLQRNAWVRKSARKLSPVPLQSEYSVAAPAYSIQPGGPITGPTPLAGAQSTIVTAPQPVIVEKAKSQGKKETAKAKMTSAPVPAVLSMEDAALYNSTGQLPPYYSGFGQQNLPGLPPPPPAGYQRYDQNPYQQNTYGYPPPGGYAPPNIYPPPNGYQQDFSRTGLPPPKIPQAQITELKDDEPEEEAPTGPWHKCATCKAPRSSGYHKDHPLIPGRKVVDVDCSRCERIKVEKKLRETRIIYTDDEASSDGSHAPPPKKQTKKKSKPKENDKKVDFKSKGQKDSAEEDTKSEVEISKQHKKKVKPGKQSKKVESKPKDQENAEKDSGSEVEEPKQIKEKSESGKQGKKVESTPKDQAYSLEEESWSEFEELKKPKTKQHKADKKGDQEQKTKGAKKEVTKQKKDTQQQKSEKSDEHQKPVKSHKDDHDDTDHEETSEHAADTTSKEERRHRSRRIIITRERDNESDVGSRRSHLWVKSQRLLRKSLPTVEEDQKNVSVDSWGQPGKASNPDSPRLEESIHGGSDNSWGEPVRKRITSGAHHVYIEKKQADNASWDERQSHTAKRQKDSSLQEKHSGSTSQKSVATSRAPAPKDTWTSKASIRSVASEDSMPIPGVRHVSRPRKPSPPPEATDRTDWAWPSAPQASPGSEWGVKSTKITKPASARSGHSIPDAEWDTKDQLDDTKTIYPESAKSRNSHNHQSSVTTASTLSTDSSDSTTTSRHREQVYRLPAARTLSYNDYHHETSRSRPTPPVSALNFNPPARTQAYSYGSESIIVVDDDAVPGAYPRDNGTWELDKHEQHSHHPSSLHVGWEERSRDKSLPRSRDHSRDSRQTASSHHSSHRSQPHDIAPHSSSRRQPVEDRFVEGAGHVPFGGKYMEGEDEYMMTGAIPANTYRQPSDDATWITDRRYKIAIMEKTEGVDFRPAFVETETEEDAGPGAEW
ncbi:hypothetical protein BT63DRAFT_474324 [Microthyrium microscopicum]|uniref:Uncharacterized protein n=1 Tax=Microthyrium microscopicum TaxID=703497 RepID=A0A6A6US52_9PEZI|nr:hypothetical protein BT63DRAFT_474324 [Microthyrium microscopicum]